MPRKPRHDEAGQTYHVWANGVAGSFIFKDAEDRDVVLKLLHEEVALSNWTCLSYTVLSSHYHLLLRLNTSTLSTGMQRLNRRYALYHNRRYRQRGHCFEQRFQSNLVPADPEAELYVARYIALNPKRAGLCKLAEEYPWSSYGATIGLYPRDPIVDATAALAPARGSRTVYRRYVEQSDLRLRGRLTRAR